MKLTDYFERVCVLNLTCKHDRKSRLLSHLAEVEVLDPKKVTWVRAIEGEQCPAPGYFTGGNGAWGCLQTHSKVVQEAAMDKVSSCLLLEDDVVFHRDSPRLLQRFLPALPADWDQVYLGGQFLREPEPTRPGSPVWRGLNVNRTHAYGLHARVFKRYLQHIHHAPNYIEHGGWHIDHQLGLAHEARQWNTYCPTWWIAGQASGNSNISGKSNEELWWQAHRHARALPWLYVAPQHAALCETMTQGRVFFGANVRPGEPVDPELDQAASEPAKLRTWMEATAGGALDTYRLPGICHPRVSLEQVQREWNHVIAFTPETDLAHLCDYPANGLFANELFEGGPACPHQDKYSKHHPVVPSFSSAGGIAPSYTPLP